MTLEPTSAAIIQLAWARRLGLDDDAFAAAAARPASAADTPGDPRLRITRADEAAREVVFLRLFGVSVLVGPQWALDAGAALPDTELAQHVTLLTLTRSHGGHGLGSSALFFADDLPLQQPSDDLMVSHGNPEAILLEGLCPPDDVNEVGLQGRGHRFTVMHPDEEQPTPVACGAYSESEGILADLGVLVAPQWRRRGLGTLAASIAAHEALASGLTLQWKADVSNTGALAMARHMGFATGGLHASVRLG
ncbi:GNAT family N-acetyltransferase [Paenarthrobacter ilicis]|uniref:GNAT family N-acetyltransferase n=1 Tax=Paenarthrobacter ilicis TaxID=43665 RepID=UPI00300B9F1F